MVVMKRILNLLLSLSFWACILLLFWVFGQVFLFASFRIPTDSMEPMLTEGDNILVNKCLYGPRIFNLSKALNEEEIENIYRVPGLKKIKRNDVLVFNFPHPIHWDSISFDITKYYVKRCIAVPGDTLLIENASYSVMGCPERLGNRASQQHLSGYLETMDPDSLVDGQVYRGVYVKGFPGDSRIDWDIRNFGPLYIPKKGAEIEMNCETMIIYKKVIEWEQKKKLTFEGGNVYLGNEALLTYTFLKNYYFAGGDKTENSQDSRYWGLLPEEYIVGKATHIWKSIHPYTGKIRWERVFKKIE